MAGRDRRGHGVGGQPGGGDAAGVPGGVRRPGGGPGSGPTMGLGLAVELGPLTVHDRQGLGGGTAEGQQHLHQQLVPRRALGARTLVEPVVERPLARWGQLPPPTVPTPRLGIGRILIDGLDQAIGVKSFERCVHLAHVHGPHPSGSGLEGAFEVVAVSGTLFEQGQQTHPH